MNHFMWLPHSMVKGIDLPTIEFVEKSDQLYGGYYQGAIDPKKI